MSKLHKAVMELLSPVYDLLSRWLFIPHFWSLWESLSNNVVMETICLWTTSVGEAAVIQK